MEVPHNAYIVVADGEKALFLRNKGDSTFLNLKVVEKETQDNPPDREQSANRPGRMNDGMTGHKSAMDDTDWHELNKERFAGDISDMLYKKAHAHEFDKLILIAPPSTLGEMRQELHKEVQNCLLAEIDKDLTNHTISDIETILQSSR